MNSTLSLNTTLKMAVLALLLVASLFFIPGQAAGLGHGSRLMQLADIEGSAGFVARIESPDMLLARLAVEGTGISTSVAVDTAVVGINIWALLLVLALSLGLVWILFSWQRLFTVGEKDVERLMNRCEIVGQGC